jgi:hypothetical protein
MDALIGSQDECIMGELTGRMEIEPVHPGYS